MQDPTASQERPVPRPVAPYRAATGADKVDTGGVVGAFAITGDACRAINVLQQQAAPLLYHWALGGRAQVTDGRYLRVGALQGHSH